MFSTIVKRLLQGMLVIICITIITFVIIRLIPGDPSRTMAPSASPEKIEELSKQMGFGDTIPVQFGKYVKNIFQGDFGWSFFQKADVTVVIAATAPITSTLILFALILAIVFGVGLGIIAAIKNNTWIDKIISGLAVTLQSMPNYWVALMLIMLISVKWRLLPSVGYQDISYAILPSIVLALPLTAVLIRNVRSSLIDSMNLDFVKAARARGIAKSRVLFRYSFRNSLIPLLTVLGTQIGYLIGSAVVVEYIFGIPGLGLTTLNAVLRRDYYLIQGLVVVLAALFILINMIIDISYSYLDPRLRKAQGGL